MIEELIEEGQYQVALSRLTDMDDEMTRYYRLVCLNALEDYQRCMQEGAVAKMQANNTYYEVTALYLNALKELEEYEQAINILMKNYPCLISLSSMKTCSMQFMMKLFL